MAVSDFDDVDYGEADARLQLEWSRANAARDAERTRAANERDKFRRATGPTFAPPPSGGSARGSATAEWAAGQLTQQDAEYRALVADNRRHMEARASPRGSVPQRNLTVAERHAAEVMNDGAA